jgi:hypothetical protein
VLLIEVKFASLIVGLLLGASPVLSPAVLHPIPSPGPCSSAEYHQFDFWLGNWQVRTRDGKTAGANTIERTLGGCVLHENWRGASGSRGNSYNIYDASRKQWHQTWVDNQGQLLQLDGGLRDGRMVLSGETVDSTGKRTEQRITWERVGQGQVRQLWESSSDGGRTWAVAFDGIYSRAHP